MDTITKFRITSKVRTCKEACVFLLTGKQKLSPKLEMPEIAPQAFTQLEEAHIPQYIALLTLQRGKKKKPLLRVKQFRMYRLVVSYAFLSHKQKIITGVRKRKCFFPYRLFAR